MNKLSFKNSFIFILVGAFTFGGFLSFTNTTFAADTTPPVIKILGDNPLNLEAGGTFIDPGFSVIDNFDGNITSETSNDFLNDGPVDMNEPGTYIFGYRACDKSGNCAEASRTIRVWERGQVLGVDKYNFTLNLSNGAKGNEVVELQKFLNAKGFDCGFADGQFGPKTKKAVMAFQSANILMADGIIGPISRAILNK